MAKASKRPPGEDPPATERPARQTPDAAIRDGVMSSLGQPPGLFRVVVLPLWRNYYRVNVLTGADATSIRIVHSFFVEAGDDGAILSASPPIVRQYP